MVKIIAWFEELNKNSVDIAGGKGANLGEMQKAGFPIPPGFVVTAQAYKEFLDRTGIYKEIEELLNKLDVNDTKSLQKTAKEIQTIIKSEVFPEDFKKPVIEAYKNILIGKKHIELNKKALELIKPSRQKEPYVAVRSSATAEDLPEASFAGQQESFLNVKGEEALLEAVKNCWASLFTARAIYYREKNKFPHEKVLISVIIQRMVDSEKSGVAFSIHPTTGDKDLIIIEAGWGLGEYIVKGVINPDHYEVSKTDWTIKKKLVNKQNKMLIKDPISGKNTDVEVPERKQEKQILDDEQIITLAKVTKKIEKHYGVAQDVEWASSDNRLYIVQSRPVTFFGKKAEEGEEVKAAEGEVLLKGLPASPGIASGPVKMIHDASELDKVIEGCILVTEMTAPDMVPAMERAAAIVTDKGGLTSHAAIVSRELGVPCIVGTSNATKILKDDMIITVDANKGIVLKAGEKALEEQEKKEEVKEIKQATFSMDAPVTATKVYMNLGIPEKIIDYARLPTDGIGLMRIEFIIASHIGVHPNKLIADGKADEYINKLAEGVKKIAEVINPKPVIVRFSDFKTNEYRDLEGGEAYEPHEDNPMIGWRGCSRYVSKEFEQVFRLECKAIKKVRDDGLRNVWVMLPFVRVIDEVKQVLRILKSEGLARGRDFKVWLMAEVPSIIILADKFAELCDGFSIGSNDLTQLILGVDRDSEKLGKMGYFDERNHAVLASISRLIRLAHDKGVTVSICGQAPSVYPEVTEFLIRQGIDSISVNPDVVLKTKHLISSVERKILLESARHEISHEPEEKKITGLENSPNPEPENYNDIPEYKDKKPFWP